MKIQNSYFVPLNIDKRLWDFDKKLLLLDIAFERQLSIEEKKIVDYEVLPTISFKHTKYEIDLFEAKLIDFFAEKLNEHHGEIFDFCFWKKLFHPWLGNFIYNTISKVECLEELVKSYPDVSFFTACYSSNLDKKFLKEYGGLFSNEEYNNYVFCLIAKNYFGFNVSIANLEGKNKFKDCSFAPQIIKEKSFFERLKHLTIKKIIRKGCKILEKINKSLFKPELLLWCTYFSSDATEYFSRKSHGKIRTLSIPHIDMESEVDLKIRQKLRESANEYFSSDNLKKTQKILLEVIFDLIPFYYIENFKKYLNNAKSFLKSNKNVRMFFATCTYCRETEPFLLTYSQHCGIKNLSEMHGGNYGIVEGIHRMEAFLNDTLYLWGTWASNVYDSSCEFLSAPSYRNYLLYDKKEQHQNYILFLGSCNEVYISSDCSYFAGYSGIHNSMDAEIDFFSCLTSEAMNSMLVRNYCVDFGFHFDELLHMKFPKLKIQGYLQSDYNENFDPIARNDSFANTLLNCSLILVNEFETCFIEALYCEKPFIILFNKYGFPLRLEEVPYFKMMEDVGLLFYDWNKAAEKVNEIHKDINSWWNDEERQRVVKIIRNRYSMSVKDIKKWWYDEFTYQLKKYKRDKRYELKNNSHISTSARLKGI